MVAQSNAYISAVRAYNEAASGKSFEGPTRSTTDDLKQGDTGVTSYIMGDELVTSASKHMIIPIFEIHI